MGNLIPTLEWLAPHPSSSSSSPSLRNWTVKQLSPFIKLAVVMLDQQLFVFDPCPFYNFVIVLVDILPF